MQKIDGIEDEIDLINDGTIVSVEKEGIIANGRISYLEGDFMEIEVAQHDLFTLGDAVKVTAYGMTRMISLNTFLIATDTELLILINPQKYQKPSLNRQHPRVNVFHEGNLFSIGDSANNQDEPLYVKVLNISLGGIGLQIEDDQGLKPLSLANLKSDLLEDFSAHIEITRKDVTESGTYIGAKFVHLPRNKIIPLRVLVLYIQIIMRSMERKAS